ncbi:hypothetical protein FHW12_000349 [Dokdonella fugitiva]|uniref:Uncharacterized protein n=1 Tax=Dokdonella fugitiva TaxID=328517 RepID=A0A839EY90_9GAMM|nr:hypothetical protein [Dokdonella fugitiva]MBA8886158.1 hypothetical protein [Dokdonella fugitiva]
MTAFYDRAAATALRMLTKYGKGVRVTSTNMAGAVTAREGKAVLVSVVKHDLGNSGISIGDHKLLVEASLAPKPGDRILDLADGASRVIVDPVNPIKPADTLIAFECYARLG